MSKAELEMYRHTEERRGLQISRIWETMKLTTTIVFGLFTATVAILGFPKPAESWIVGIVAFLPIFSIFISIWSLINVRRQYSRFLEIITWISKVEEHLSLHDLVPERFLESKNFKTEDAFIKSKLHWCSDTMYGSFAKLHVLYVTLAIILTILIVIFYFVG